MKYLYYLTFTLYLLLSLTANDQSSEKANDWPYDMYEKRDYIPEMFYRGVPQLSRAKKKRAIFNWNLSPKQLSKIPPFFYRDKNVKIVEFGAVVLSVLPSPGFFSGHTATYQGIVVSIERVVKGKISNEAIIVYCPLMAASSKCEVDESGKAIISRGVFREGNYLRIKAQQMPNNDYVLLSVTL